MSGKRKEENVGSEEALRDSPRESEAEGEGRPRYLLIGGVMLGLIVAIIAGAFLLNERFRPRVGIEPAPSVVVPTATPSAPAPVVVVPPTVASPESTAPTATASQAPTIAATSASTSSTGAVGSAKPTPSEALEREVEQAYLKYWDVYSDTLLNLDASKMSEVAADNGLSRVQEEVADFQRRKAAVRVRVTHSLLVFDVTDTDAKIYDEILDQSFLVDPTTKLPSESSNQGTLVKDTFILKRIDGTWKVVEHLRNG